MVERCSRRHQSLDMWNAIPLCLMLCIWREHNARTFEGIEASLRKLKIFYFWDHFDWMSPFFFWGGGLGG